MCHCICSFKLLDSHLKVSAVTSAGKFAEFNKHSNELCLGASSLLFRQPERHSHSSKSNICFAQSIIHEQLPSGKLFFFVCSSRRALYKYKLRNYGRACIRYASITRSSSDLTSLNRCLLGVTSQFRFNKLIYCSLDGS